MNAYVEILRDDGSVERSRLEGDQFTVGRGMRAALPLPDARELEDEHLLIAPRGDKVWLAVVQQAKHAARINGDVFQHGLVAWGVEIDLGVGIRLRIHDRDPTVVKSERKGPSPVLVLALIAVVGFTVVALRPRTRANLDRDAPEPINLFAEVPTCEAAPAARLSQADLFAELGLARSERYPFDPSDGVQAVLAYRRAEACYGAAGVQSSASEMRAEADFMQRRVNDDYAAHQLRLERALDGQRDRDALFETNALLAFLRVPQNGEDARRSDPALRDGIGTNPYRENPYFQWLTRNQRVLQLRLAPRAGRR